MAPFPATVRYRYGERGESRDASFHGLFFDRSDRAVARRLGEVHRFAAWLEVVEVRWGGGGAAWEGRRDHRQYTVPARGRPGRAPLQAGGRPARGGAAEGAPCTGHRWQPRRHDRCRMFKPAHLVLDGGVLDCVLLDLSPGGAQVCLMARAEVPDLATLWLPSRESRAVRRRWQRGSRVGFEAAGDAVPPS